VLQNNTKILSPCLQLAVLLLLKMELAEEARLPANFVDTSAGRTCMARGMFEGLYQDEWRPTTPHLWTPWRHPPKHVHCARQWSWESKNPASVYHLARNKAPRERADAHKKELNDLKRTVNLKTRDIRGGPSKRPGVEPIYYTLFSFTQLWSTRVCKLAPFKKLWPDRKE